MLWTVTINLNDKQMACIMHPEVIDADKLQQIYDHIKFRLLEDLKKKVRRE